MKKKSQLKWCVNRHNIKIYYYNNKSLDLQILKVHWRATSYDGSNLFYRTQQMHPRALKFYPFEKSIIFDSSRLIMFCQQLTWASVWLITNILLKCRCQLLIGKKDPANNKLQHNFFFGPVQTTSMKRGEAVNRERAEIYHQQKWGRC